MQKRRKKKKEEEALLTLLPSNMMTTSFWAYSCISVSQAFKKYKRHTDTEELRKKKCGKQTPPFEDGIFCCLLCRV